MSSSSLPPLSAAVTRILSLTGFPSTVKTKDVQAAFSDYEGLGGGFKIKWVDDNSLLLVFNEAAIAKRAYLSTILLPPASLASDDVSIPLQIKPYDGPDAQAVIFTVNNRRNNPNRASVSHGRNISVATGALGAIGGVNGGPRGPYSGGPTGNGNGLSSSMHAPSPPNTLSVDEGPGGRGGSPTLPDLATQPTLSSMLGSSLSELTSADVDGSAVDDSDSPESGPAATLRDAGVGGGVAAEKTPPRVGDAGKRMVGAALGVKHPGVASRRVGANDAPSSDGLNKAMDGLTISQ